MNRFRDTDDELPVPHKNPRCGKTSQLNADERDKDARRMESVEIDHTKLDLMVLDERTGPPIARPWLVFEICAFTKMIVGCCLLPPEDNEEAKV